MAKKKTTVKASPGALGDDPLAWIKDDTVGENINLKETQVKPEKAEGKKNPAGKKTTNRKNEAKKDQVKKMRETKALTENSVVEDTFNDSAGETKTSLQAPFKLEPVLAISDAQKLYPQLATLLDAKQDITIDVSAVEMLDTAILQLLLAFVIKVKSENHQVVWVKPSSEMIHRVKTLGMQTVLGMEGLT